MKNPEILHHFSDGLYAKQVLEPMEITPIVLATITDCMERWGNGKS